MPPLTWVFAGSKIMPEKVYAADVTGYLVTVINFELAVIDVPLLASSANETLVVFGLWGGALADAMDRRKLVLASEAGLGLLSGLLLLNALMPTPVTVVCVAKVTPRLRAAAA